MAFSSEKGCSQSVSAVTNFELFKKLIECGADVNRFDENGDSDEDEIPIFSSFNHPEAMDYLLEKGSGIVYKSEFHRGKTLIDVIEEECMGELVDESDIDKIVKVTNVLLKYFPDDVRLSNILRKYQNLE